VLQVLRRDGNSGQPWRGQTFFGSDNVPVTFADMMAACTDSGVFTGQVTFTAGAEAGLGKKVDSSRSRAALGGWKPKYSSFRSFMEEQKGKDWYNTSGLF